MNSIHLLLSNVKLHRKSPAQGRYMTYKEILSLSVGGIGFGFIVYRVLFPPMLIVGFVFSLSDYVNKDEV